MSTFTYDVAYDEPRNRLTVTFRIILAIPHLIISQVWGQLTQILAVVQWFIIVFTGKRNEGIWNLQRSWLNYYARVLGYVDLLFDPYPPFASDEGPAPVRSGIAFEEQADRLTSGLRFLWMIPAAILAALLGIVSGVLVLVSWFAIVITGKHPKGMWDFILKVLRYTLQTQSYGLLMTDTYPKFDDGSVAMAATPPAPFASPPPPPPPPR